MSSVWTIKGLGANRPNPELVEKMMLFGQFVGDWEISSKRLGPEGKWHEGTGEVHFGWILDGRAVQDVWISHKENPRRSEPAGTTIRFYDSGLDAWRCVWIAPAGNIVRTFIARKVGDEIVLEGKTDQGRLERRIFSKIEQDSFHWRAIESSDEDRKDWKLTEEMEIRRVSL